MEKARELYNSEEVSSVICSQPAYRFHYLMENVDDDSDGISITAWDNEADATA